MCGPRSYDAGEVGPSGPVRDRGDCRHALDDRVGRPYPPAGDGGGEPGSDAMSLVESPAPTTDGSSRSPEGTVRIEVEDPIGWLYFNRPEKRNAMNPVLNAEMPQALETLDRDDRVRVVVLTGCGWWCSPGPGRRGRPAWTCGSTSGRWRGAAAPAGGRTSAEWQWRRLIHCAEPTIAMVNGWCFGGAFTPLVCCDLAIAAEDAVFGLSEVNWGVPARWPGQPGPGRDGADPRRPMVHHDRRDVRRPPGRRDAPRQRGRACRPAGARRVRAALSAR